MQLRNSRRPVSAANAILDPDWGKATQPLENSGKGALQLI
jgi:hypothetical protein